MYQAVFFDAGNTLFYTPIDGKERIRRVLASRGLEFTPEAIERAVAQVEEEPLGPDKPRYYLGVLEALGIGIREASWPDI